MSSLPAARHRVVDDTGTTLAETVVSVLAGSLVLAAAAALFVPASQSSDRARRAGENLSAANAVSGQLQRQVRDATYVSAPSTTQLRLLTYATPSAASRTCITWIFTAAGGLTETRSTGTTTHGDAKTFSAVTFSPTGAAVAPNALLTATLTTSGSTGTGATTGVPSTTLTVAASPRSTQDGTCS